MSQILAFEYDEGYSPPFPVIEIEINGYSDAPSLQITTLVDSGADGSMIPLNILQAIGASYEDSVAMVGVGGTTQIVDRYLVEVKIGPFTIRSIHAVAHENEAIIGRDVLNDLSVRLNGPSFMTEIQLD